MVRKALDANRQLTYMSIEEEILDRTSRGMLFPMIPRAPGGMPVRALFVVEGLRNALQSPPANDAWERRIGELQADMDRFVCGDLIDPKYLFLLYPGRDSVWEIRSTGSNPSIRVLGLFAQKDVFVATNFALRSDLGSWQSRRWKEVKRDALAKWRWLFGPYQPLAGSDIDQLVSGALNGRYFK